MKVTQEDRDAVRALRGSDSYALGFYDHTPLVQAFAAHREAAEARGVEWLRELRAEQLTPGVCAFVGDAFGYDGQAMCGDLAKMIEAGEHLKG